MNTKVFTQFRAAVNSYPLGEMNLGILVPGRYSGFDIMTGTSLAIKIGHSGRVLKSSASVGGVITSTTFGALVMPNGCTIQNENTGTGDGISLNVDSNTGNANPRYDLVVCEHEYVQVAGGVAPLFFLQKGPNTGEVPALAQPKKQIIIGIIKSDPNGNSFAALTYTKSPVPNPGDNTNDEVIENLGIDQMITELGIQEVLNHDPVINSDSDIQVPDDITFGINKPSSGSINSRYYGVINVAHLATQVAGTVKAWLGISSVTNGNAWFKFQTDKTIFEDTAHDRGLEYAGNHATVFDANDRSIPDVAWVKSKIPSNVMKVAVVKINSWTDDSQFTVATGLSSTDTIHNVELSLECISAYSSHALGDIVTAPTPYPIDSGRTSAQGIGIQYKTAGNAPIHVLVNDQVTIMGPWTGDGSTIDTESLVPGSTIPNWALRLVIIYTS